MYRSYYVIGFIVLFFFVATGLVKEVDAADGYYIKPVTFIVNSEDQETFSFPVSEGTEYSIFILNGDMPRLVIDFPNAIYKGEKTKIFSESEFVSGIRSAFHKQPNEKTRIVIDLNPKEEVEYRDFFDTEKQVLRVVITRKGVSVVPGQTMQEEDVDPLPIKDLVFEEEVVADEKVIADAESAEDKKDLVLLKDEHPSSPEIRSISFEALKPGEERVYFHLNGFYPPKITTDEDTIPQVICHFTDTRLLENVEEKIETSGNLVHRIISKQSDETSNVQVILVLSGDKNFDLQQVFFKDGNLFVLIVRELVEGSAVE